VFTSPIEMFSVTVGIAIKGGIVASIPMAVIGTYRLVRPLLPDRARLFLVLFLPAVFLSYAGGTAFAYFVMLPTGLRFLLHFGTNIAVPMIRITEYLSLVTALLFWLGIVFELPLVMFLLTKLGIVSHKRFRKLRKYVPAAAFILSALITPTFDAVNQTMVAVPLIALYEVGLILAWLAEGGGNTLAIPLMLVVAECRGLWDLVWHLIGVARRGQVSRVEWRRLRDALERGIIGPYLRMVRRVG
jgi:sec-independent protein translocase protein TatC